MTTERQRAANTANAKKSTGPKSSAGLNRSSKNARKHGLTASPLWGDVTKWFRIILEDPGATPDPVARDESLRAAFQLAEAEAHLERCQQTERTHLASMLDHAGSGPTRPTKDTVEKVLKYPNGTDTLKVLIEDIDDLLLAGDAKILTRSHPDRPAALRRDMQRFRRYRREAEGRRRKALAAWISHASQNSKKYETNPIAITGCNKPPPDSNTR